MRRHSAPKRPHFNCGSSQQKKEAASPPSRPNRSHDTHGTGCAPLSELRVPPSNFHPAHRSAANFRASEHPGSPPAHQRSETSRPIFVSSSPVSPANNLVSESQEWRIRCGDVCPPQHISFDDPSARLQSPEPPREYEPQSAAPNYSETQRARARQLPLNQTSPAARSAVPRAPLPRAGSLSKISAQGRPRLSFGKSRPESSF